MTPRILEIRIRVAPAALRFGALLCVASAALAQPAPPPNLVPVSNDIVTSGQPSAEWLATLGAQKFEAVVYLAPPTVPDAVRDEARIVAGQGIAFVNIPIRFDAPSERDFALFASVMQALRDRKVLVHCQVNFRASSMVFLFRAVARREDPDRAYDAVIRVWKPDDTWRRFVEGELRRAGVAFELY